MINMNFEKHIVALSLLALLLLRILVTGASIGDALAFIALTSFTGYSLFLQNRNRDVEKSQTDKIDSLYLEHKEKTEYFQNELNALRQQVGLIKVDNGFSSVTKTQPSLPKVNQNEKKRYF